MRLLEPLFHTSGLFCLMFLTFKASMKLFAYILLLPVCDGFLRINSGVTPADLLVTSMAAKQA